MLVEPHHCQQHLQSFDWNRKCIRRPKARTQLGANIVLCVSTIQAQCALANVIRS